MSLCTDEFSSLLDAQEEWCGERLQATVGDVTADAIVEALSFTEILVAGGTAEEGGYRLQMLMSDFPDGLPAQLTPATARGKTLSVLSAVENNGVYLFQIGSPVRERR